MKSRILSYLDVIITLIYLVSGLTILTRLLSFNSSTSNLINIFFSISHTTIPLILGFILIGAVKFKSLLNNMWPITFEISFRIAMSIQLLWHIIIVYNSTQLSHEVYYTTISVKQTVIIQLPILIWLVRTFIKRITI